FSSSSRFSTSVQLIPSVEEASRSLALPSHHSFPGRSGLYTMKRRPPTRIASVPEFGFTRSVFSRDDHVLPPSVDHAVATTPSLLRHKTCRRPSACWTILGCITLNRLA